MENTIDPARVNPVDFVKAWVKELRTTNIPQGRRKLSQMGHDCCLGIACRVGKALHIRGAGFLDEGDGLAEQKTSNGYPGSWLGQVLNLDTSNPRLRVKGYHDAVRVADLNDEDKFSFAMIADALEQTFVLKIPETGNGNSTPPNS